jgi:hypothetical protein
MIKEINLKNNLLSSLEGIKINPLLVDNFNIEGNPIKTFTDVPYKMISGLISHLNSECVDTFSLSNDEYSIVKELVKSKENTEAWENLEIFIS